MREDNVENAWRALVERTLDEVLPPAAARPAVLAEAMRYAVGGAGKRIRPLLAFGASVAVGGSAEDAKYPAAAIELLHNYTLVHDDLPAMDNDTLRRGAPTVWTKFGEANAILVGDALQALAYRTAARAPRNVAAIVDVLGEMGVGVVRGQVEDVAAGRDQKIASTELQHSAKAMRSPGEATSSSLRTEPQKESAAEPHDNFIYTHKTSDLFVAAAAMGALAGGGDATSVARLRAFALNLGLAFQYEDDLLDGDGIYDRATTARLVRETTDAAVAALADLPGDTTFLRTLAEKLTTRTT